MRTILPRKIPKRSVTSPIAVLLLTAAIPLGTACDDDKDYSRREYIEWSDTPEFDRKPDILHFSVNGSPENGCNAIYVRTNVPFTATVEFEEDEDNGEATAPAWLELVKIEHDYLPGISRLLCKAAPHPGTYKERKGCISLHTEVEYLNDFIPIVQGFPARVEGDFDWLKYGSANPLETRGETAISGWTAEQKDKGWESTPAEEEGTAHCYGKNGYVRLGDDLGHGANLLSPYKPEIRSDTAVLVRFNAIAYAAADGTKDANELTVTVKGGGQFLDGATSKKLVLNHFDPSDEELPESMWENSRQEFIVISHPKNTFTSNTRIELMAGDYVMESGNTRIFIDDFYIFRLRWYDYDDLFGGLPWEQQKNESGK